MEVWGGGMFRKKARVGGGEDKESSQGNDDQFLPDDGDVQEDTNPSAEVWALMAQLAHPRTSRRKQTRTCQRWSG